MNKRCKFSLRRCSNRRTADRLSRMPDEILIHILSKLDSTNCAFRACLSSKRYSNLWLYVPNPSFVSTPFNKLRSFDRFVDGAISFRLEHNVPTTSFALSRRGIVSQRRLDSIMDYVASAGVQHLNLHFQSCKRGENTEEGARFEFSCESLKSLELCIDGDGYVIPFSVPTHRQFDKLESLYLRSCLFDHTISDNLFSNFPSLLHLTLYTWYPNINISAPRLSTLKLISTNENWSAKISSPDITSLHLASQMYARFYIDTGLHLLQTVSLDLCYDPYPGYLELWTKTHGRETINMIQGLRSAKHLTVSPMTLQVFFRFPGSLLLERSPFRKLETLKIKKSMKQVSEEIPGDVISYLLSRSMCAAKIVLELAEEEFPCTDWSKCLKLYPIVR